MSLTTSEASLSDLAAVVDNNRNNGLFGGDGLYAILVVVFIIALMGGGFGGFGGFGGGFGNGLGGAMVGAGMMDNIMMWPWMMSQNVDNDVQGGFNQMATANAIGNLQGAVTSGFGDTQLGIAGVNQNICQTGAGIVNGMNQGFANVQTSLCNGFNSVNQGVSSGFAQAEISNNARQMANMQQAFGTQTAITQGINGLSSQFADCCCENRLATANLQSVIQAENCADREAINTGIRDLMMNGTANTQSVLNSINSGIQSIQDKLCAQELEAERRENFNLRQQLNMASLQASQSEQTARLMNDNAAQTQYVVNRIAPYPVPAYQVSNPYGYNGYNNCGCGSCGCNG